MKYSEKKVKLVKAALERLDYYLWDLRTYSEAYLINKNFEKADYKFYYLDIEFEDPDRRYTTYLDPNIKFEDSNFYMDLEDYLLFYLQDNSSLKVVVKSQSYPTPYDYPTTNLHRCTIVLEDGKASITDRSDTVIDEYCLKQNYNEEYIDIVEKFKDYIHYKLKSEPAITECTEDKVRFATGHAYDVKHDIHDRVVFTLSR